MTQEELDAAIDAVNSNLDTMESTLTSMIDMLSMQILDLQQNRVQRCKYNHCAQTIMYNSNFNSNWTFIVLNLSYS